MLQKGLVSTTETQYHAISSQSLNLNVKMTDLPRIHTCPSIAQKLASKLKQYGTINCIY